MLTRGGKYRDSLEMERIRARPEGTSIWGYLFTVTDFALSARADATGERNN